MGRKVALQQLVHETGLVEIPAFPQLPFWCMAIEHWFSPDVV